MCFSSIIVGSDAVIIGTTRCLLGKPIAEMTLPQQKQTQILQDEFFSLDYPLDGKLLSFTRRTRTSEGVRALMATFAVSYRKKAGPKTFVNKLDKRLHFFPSSIGLGFPCFYYVSDLTTPLTAISINYADRARSPH
jgi:hypothetical protein